MDPAQVKAFRETLRQFLPPLCEMNEILLLSGNAQPDLKLVARNCEDVLRKLLSTFDPDEKLALVKEFCDAKFPAILALCNAEFVQDLRKPIALFPVLLKDFLERQKVKEDEASEIVSVLMNLDETLDKIDLESEPIDVQQQINKIKEKCTGANAAELSEFQKTAESYRILYGLISEIKCMQDYVEKFGSDEGPPRTTPHNPATRGRESLGLPVKKSSKIAMPLVKADVSVVENLRLVKIDAEPLYFGKNGEGQRMRSGMHLGNLCLKGIVPAKLGRELKKKGEGCTSSRDNSDSSSGEVDEVLEAFDQFISTFSPDGPQAQTELLKQKCVILTKENSVLRDNYHIVMKQKEEMMQLYEDHITELIKQNQLLKTEIAKLKEKAEERTTVPSEDPPVASDPQ